MNLSLKVPKQLSRIHEKQNLEIEIDSNRLNPYMNSSMNKSL